MTGSPRPARQARGAEMDARLALRTMEERVRALAGRSDALRRAAAHERCRAGQGAGPPGADAAGGEGGRGGARRRRATWPDGSRRPSRSPGSNGPPQTRPGPTRRRRWPRSAGRLRTLTHDFESLVDTVHRDEMARAEQRMRLEALTEKAMTELGLEPDGLVADYGPDQPVPVLTRPDGTALGPGRRGAGADPVRARAAAEAAADGGACARCARAG